MNCIPKSVIRSGSIILLTIGIATGSVGGGALCWDIFSNNQMIDPCTAGAPCLGGCNPFDDIRPGTTHLTVWSDPTPVSIICYPGTVKIDQFGNCVCMDLKLSNPQPKLVGVISGDDACFEQ